VRAQRAALYRIEPSTELNNRFDATLEAWMIERSRTGRRHLSVWAWAAAATLVLVIGAGWFGWRALEERKDPIVENPGYVRVVPPGTAVMRVQASLGAPIPVWAGNGFPTHRSRYWVDVGVGSDGALYIERVTPIDESPESFAP
jgi:hypothetical protein